MHKFDNNIIAIDVRLFPNESIILHPFQSHGPNHSTAFPHFLQFQREMASVQSWSLQSAAPENGCQQRLLGKAGQVRMMELAHLLK